MEANKTAENAPKVAAFKKKEAEDAKKEAAALATQK